MTAEQTEETVTNRLAITLALDITGETSPHGPGWYIWPVANTGGYWKQPVIITPAQAYAIAEVMDHIVTQQGVENNATLTGIVKWGNVAVRNNVRLQIDEAQERLQEIDKLKEHIMMLHGRLHELGGSDIDSDIVDVDQPQEETPKRPKRVQRAKKPDGQQQS